MTVPIDTSGSLAYSIATSCLGFAISLWVQLPERVMQWHGLTYGYEARDLISAERTRRTMIDTITGEYTPLQHTAKQVTLPATEKETLCR